MTEFTIQRSESGSRHLYEDGEIVESSPCPEVVDALPVLIDVAECDGCKPTEKQVHRRLYDHHQCHHTFENGDTITFEHDGTTYLYEVSGVHVHYRGPVRERVPQSYALDHDY